MHDLGRSTPLALTTDAALARRIVVRTIDQLDVGGALAATSDVVLDLEFHLLAFLDGVEDATRKGRVMEEDFRTIVATDEPETTIPDHPHYCAPHEPLPPKQSATVAYCKGRKIRASSWFRTPMMGAF